MRHYPSRIRWTLVTVIALSPWILPTPRATAQGPDAGAPALERRVQELEATVRRLEAERTPLQTTSLQTPPPPPGALLSAPSSDSGLTEVKDGSAGGVPISAGWTDSEGFFIRSADDRFHFRVTGQIQADYRAFLDGRDYTDLDTFLVRRARLGIEANMFQYYEFRL